MEDEIGNRIAGLRADRGFFLSTEHRAHVFGILPYLLILACPLMHLFHGYGGHGRHGGHDHAASIKAPDQRENG